MITNNEAAIAVTGDDIRVYKLLARKGALSLECMGMRKSGQSVYAICKQVYGFKGSKQAVLEQMRALAQKVVDHEILANELPEL